MPHNVPIHLSLKVKYSLKYKLDDVPILLACIVIKSLKKQLKYTCGKEKHKSTDIMKIGKKKKNSG